MARPKKTKAAAAPPPPPLAEALLLATLCMVGLPVEVQVRDGSVYAGVFHTACVDGGYGVVLKKARKIANGKLDANLPLGAFVDTLVVLPDDLVQVIAKNLSLASKDTCRTGDCDVVAASGSIKAQTLHLEGSKKSRSENVSPLKQVEKCSRLGQENDISIGKSAPMKCTATSCRSPTGQMAQQFSWNGISSSTSVQSKDRNVTSSVSAAPTVASNAKTYQPAHSASKIVMPSKPTAKESKLNPRAKIFSPSFASSRPVLSAAHPVNPNYISNSVTEVPTGVPVFETHSLPSGPSLSSKVVCYNNLPPGNFGISPQYVQPFMGHNVSRLDPARIGTPYHPMQVGQTYISPSPQPDAMHGTLVISQGWPRTVFMDSYQASLQKFQGTAPVYMAPPVMATGNQPMVVQSTASFVQPFQAIRHIMVPSASGMVPGKYM